MFNHDGGAWIAVEGVDGVGKTTVVEGLAKLLSSEGRSVVTTRHPGGTPFGSLLREVLLHFDAAADAAPEAFSMVMRADATDTFLRVIHPAIKDERLVISDRCLWSTAAYGVEEGLSEETAWRWIAQSCWGHGPDLVLILDGPTRQPEAPDNVETRGPEFAERVRERYREIAAGRREAVLVDAGGCEATVLDQCLYEIEFRRL